MTPEMLGCPCNTRVTHIVRAGENLFRIALRYRTTAAAVARLNGITNVRRVSVGQRLRIITCGRGYSSGGSIGRGATYTVQPGDTIFRIALWRECAIPLPREWSVFKFDCAGADAHHSVMS